MSKNNKVYLLAMILVILDISTIAVIGSECAKYLNISKTTKTVKLDDWGVTVDVPIDSVVKDTEENGIRIFTNQKVNSIAAPGDSGNSGFIISGTPKTNITLKYVNIVTVSKPSLWKIRANNDYYFPIKFTVDGDTRTIKLVDDEAYSYEYPTADVLPVLYKDETYDNYYIGIDWKWDFENEDNIALYDSFDTELGDNAVANPAEFEINSTLVLQWGVDTPTDTSTDVATDTPIDTPTDTTTPADYAYIDTSESAGGILPSERTLIPVLSGDYSGDEGTDAIEQGRTLKGFVGTGDSFNLLLWICILVIAVIVITIAIILLLINNRKEKRGNNAQTNS